MFVKKNNVNYHLLRFFLNSHEKNAVHIQTLVKCIKKT